MGLSFTDVLVPSEPGRSHEMHAPHLECRCVQQRISVLYFAEITMAAEVFCNPNKTERIFVINKTALSETVKQKTSCE
jgi:hypothetical protein